MRAAGIVFSDGGRRRAGKGSSQLLLALEGESLLHRAVRRALRVGLSPVIVVVGDEEDGSRATVADLACECVASHPSARPPRQDVRVALRRLDRHCDAAVLLDSGMARVSERMIGTLLAAARRCPAPLIVSRYGGATAPPLLFRRALFAELLAAHGDGTCKQVLQRHRDDTLYVDWAVELLGDGTPTGSRRPGRAAEVMDPGRRARARRRTGAPTHHALP